MTNLKMRRKKPVLEQIATGLFLGGLAMTAAFGFLSKDEIGRKEKESLERGARIVSEETDARIQRYDIVTVAGIVISGAGIGIMVLSLFLIYIKKSNIFSRERFIKHILEYIVG